MERRAEAEQEILDLINRSKWQEVASKCEEWEYLCAEVPLSKSTLPYWGIQLLVYLILNDLNAARFLWKRIPKKIKDTDAELAAVWGIGKQMWKKNYPEIYAAVQAYNWAPINAQLIQNLVESFRTRTFTLVGNAYVSISVADAASLFGLSETDTINATTRAGWKHDAASKTLIPAPNKPAKVQSTSLVQLQQLTEYVVWLEQK